MAKLHAFKGYRPGKENVNEVASRPYDVLNSKEARQEVEGNPWSFLHVVKPEVDLPEGTSLYSDEVYNKGKENLQKLIAEGYFVQDNSDMLYVYGQTMFGKTQYGIVGCAAVSDYLDETIKKHELTRPDKEEDRMNHIRVTNFNAEPVFFAYPDHAELDRVAGVRRHRVGADHAVGRDEARPRAGRLDQLRLQVRHVGVRVAQAPRLAQPDAVDDRRMVERVADHRVLGTEERLEQAAVGVEAGGVEDRVLRAEEPGDSALQFLMNALGAADEAHRGHAVAVGLQALVGGLHYLGVAREAQVVVGAEVEDRLRASLDPDLGALVPEDRPFLLEQPLLADLREPSLRMAMLANRLWYEIFRGQDTSATWSEISDLHEEHPDTDERYCEAGGHQDAPQRHG